MDSPLAGYDPLHAHYGDDGLDCIMYIDADYYFFHFHVCCLDPITHIYIYPFKYALDDAKKKINLTRCQSRV